MNPSRPPFWQRIYRLLLRLFPEDFRWDYGGEMEEVFACQYEDAIDRGGPMSTTRLWWKTITSILTTAPREHLEMIRMDTRYTFRMIRKNPLFAWVAVLTLALGIGSVTSAFSLLNAFFLRPLPFARPGQLVHIWQTDSRQANANLRVSVPNFEDWQRGSTSFQGLGGYYYASRSLGRPYSSTNVVAGVFTTNLFDVLGVSPLLGRTFLPEDGIAGQDHVVVVGEGFWRRHFEADPTVLGRTLELDEVPHQIIGVMPRSFVFPFPRTEVWTPLPLAPLRDQRAGNGPLLVVGRLREGVSREAGSQELSAVMSSLVDAYPEENDSKGVEVVDLRRALLFYYEIFQVTSLALLLAATFIVLIVCANLGNLQLARAAGRRQEIAIRAAVGAGAPRLLRQLLTESLILSMAGGGLGVILAQLCARGADRVLPMELYRVGEISVDGVTLGFALVTCVGAALTFGLAPALRATRVDLVRSLKSGGRGNGPALGDRRLQALLVVSQVALATILIAGAAIMLHSIQRLYRVETGFNPRNLATLELRLQEKAFPGAAEQDLYYEDLLQTVRNTAGVSRAAMVNPLPLNFESYSTSFRLIGSSSPAERTLFTNYFRVTTDFFETTQIDLLRGRSFRTEDNRESPWVGLVNRSWADTFSPEADPVGRRLLLTSGDVERETEIIGLVEDSTLLQLGEERSPALYLSQNQASHRRRFLLVRTAGDPQRMLAPLQALIQEIDPDLPVTEVRTMEEVLSQSLGPWRGGVAGLGFLGAGALFLAALGLYGVVSYGVGQRRQEFGVRLALGAPRRHILHMVIRQALRLTGYGIAIGLTGALVLTRLLSTLLFGFDSFDLASLLATPLVLLLVALLAALLPARQAVTIDPLGALRVD